MYTQTAIFLPKNKQNNIFSTLLGLQVMSRKQLFGLARITGWLKADIILLLKIVINNVTRDHV